MLPEPDPLPQSLPAPEDDGAARHLPGQILPRLTFTTTEGKRVQLDSMPPERWVLFLYPLTGEPGASMPRGWDQIPGARGCSQEACSFRDNLAAFRNAGVRRVFGLSADEPENQQDLVRRLQLPYPLMSDPQLSLATALGLPVLTAGDMRLYKRLTMIIDGTRIRHVFYPVFPPDSHGEEVLRWLRAQGGEQHERNAASRQ